MGGEELVLSFIGLDLLSNVANAIGSKIDGLMKHVNSSGTELGKSFTQVGSAAIGMGAGLLAVSGALAAVVIGAAMVAGTFEAKMTLLHTQAGATTAEVKAMTQAVLDMAPAVGYGPDKLADAMYHIESLGFRGAAAIDLLNTAAKGAQIGNADLEATVNALGGALVAQIGGVNSAQQAMAVLDATVGVGNMRMQDLVSAMSTGIIPAGKNFGLTLQMIGGALATLTDNAVPADEAATRLRMTFALIGAPSAIAVKQLKTIGISVLDLGKDMRSPAGLIGALTDLKGHLQKTFGPAALDDINRYTQVLATQGPAAADAYATAAGKASYVITRAFGGGRSSAGIMTLLNNLDRLKQRTDTISGMTGTFGERFAERAQNLTFKVDQLKAGFERLVIVLGTAFIPIVERVVAFITPIISAIGAWIEHHQRLAAAIMVGVIVFTALAGVFLVVFGVIAVVIGGIFALIVALPMIVAAAAPIAIAIGVTLGVMALLVAAIIAVILIISHWQQIVGIVRTVWAAVTSAIRDAWDSITTRVHNGVAAVIAFFGQLWRGVTGWITQLVSTVVIAVTGFMTRLERLWQKFASDPMYWVGYMVGWVIFTVIHLHDEVMNRLQQMTTEAIKAVFDLYTGVLAWWSRLPGDILKLITTVMTNVAKWAIDMKNKAIAMATDFVASIGRYLASLPMTVQTWLVQVISAVGRWIGDMVNGAHRAGSDFLTTLVAELKKAPGQFVQIGKDIIGGVINGIKSMISAGAGAIGSFVSGLIGAAHNAGQGHSPYRLFAREVGMGGVGAGVIEGIDDSAPLAQRAMANFIGGMSGTVASPRVGMSLPAIAARQAVGAANSATAGSQSRRERDTTDLLTRIAEGIEEFARQSGPDSALGSPATTTTGGSGDMRNGLAAFGWELQRIAQAQRYKGMRPVGQGLG